jgi:hypothetical protein
MSLLDSLLQASSVLRCTSYWTRVLILCNYVIGVCGLSINQLGRSSVAELAAFLVAELLYLEVRCSYDLTIIFPRLEQVASMHTHGV